MRSRTGTVLEGLDELGGDELAPERQRRAPGPGTRGRWPAEVAVATWPAAAEIPRATRAPRKSNQAGGRRRAIRVLTSRLSTASMNAVSSSPECHSASGLGLLSRARTRGLVMGAAAFAPGSNPA